MDIELNMIFPLNMVKLHYKKIVLVYKIYQFENKSMFLIEC